MPTHTVDIPTQQESLNPDACQPPRPSRVPSCKEPKPKSLKEKKEKAPKEPKEKKAVKPVLSEAELDARKSAKKAERKDDNMSLMELYQKGIVATWKRREESKEMPPPDVGVPLLEQGRPKVPVREGMTLSAAPMIASLPPVVKRCERDEAQESEKRRKLLDGTAVPVGALVGGPEDVKELLVEEECEAQDDSTLGDMSTQDPDESKMQDVTAVPLGALIGGTEDVKDDLAEEEECVDHVVTRRIKDRGDISDECEESFVSKDYKADTDEEISQTMHTRESALELDELGSFPLLQVCGSYGECTNQQYLAIQRLLCLAPEMAREYNDAGVYPLLELVQSFREESFIGEVSKEQIKWYSRSVSELLRVAPEMARKRAKNYEFPLMAAVKTGYKVAAVKELLRVAPEMARETVRGVTPLMSVCRSKSPNVDMVRLLLNAAPEMARHCDSDGDYPLMALLTKERSDSESDGYSDSSRDRGSNPSNTNLLIALELLRVAPEMARKRAGLGEFPLLTAIINGHVATAKEVLHIAPEMARECSQNGNFPLLAILRESQDNEIKDELTQLILDAAPEMAKKRARNNDFPLLVAARDNRAAIVKQLLCIAPEMARERTRGKSPLETSASCCWRGDPSAVQQLLIQAAPDMAGNSLLMIAIKEGSLSLVQHVLRLAPESVRTRTATGDFPLLRALNIPAYMCMRATPLIVDELLRAAPEMVRECDDNGVFPLLCAAGNHSGGEMALVNKLLDLAPEMARHSSRNGQFPLLVAASFNVRGDFVRCLLRAAPEMARNCDRLGHFPLLGATMKHGADLVRDLLKIAPEMASKSDEKGSFPLQAAVKRGDGEIVRELLSVAPEMARKCCKDGKSLLLVAVEKDYGSIVRALLLAAPEMAKQVTADDEYPLLAAINNKNATIVQALLDAAPEMALRSYGKNGDSLLKVARRRKGMEAIVEAILRAVSKGEGATSRSTSGKKSKASETPNITR